MLAIVWLSWQGTTAAAAASETKVEFADVQGIVSAHCSMCHAQEPLWPGIGVARKGILLDTAEAVHAHAREIGMQAVWTHAMPPGGNITEISDEERATLAAWLDAGAPAE
jgi:uncharacterized membrane protein